MKPTKTLNFVCEITEQPTTDTNEDFDLDLNYNPPLYEDAPLTASLWWGGEAIDSVDALLSIYSYCAERAYFKLEACKVADILSKVIDTETLYSDNTLTVIYHFDDGDTFEFCFDKEFCEELKADNSNDALTALEQAAREAAPHLFSLRKTIKCNALRFAGERFGLT